MHLELAAGEFDAFLDILILMGFHRLPTMRSYFSTNENFRVERVTKFFYPKTLLESSQIAASE
jgi:hypothetical protein